MCQRTGLANQRAGPACKGVGPTYCSYHLGPNLRTSQVALELPQASPGPHQLHETTTSTPFLPRPRKSTHTNLPDLDDTPPDLYRAICI
ncbi:hypothetical protein FJTKL_04248 [Diaporthe vaccinii]|uniref:Uncharacterized protein n=1 Tax=Diaporthe vaccinii TaxID=105482 RepID=A0ABR4F0B6_9PEZI